MAFFSSRRQPEQPEPEEREAPRSSPSPIGFETVLGGNATLEGVLSSSGNVRLDGRFSGTLHITGNILVGETAKINADIDARNISIAGAVRGNVTGNKVQILRTGRVWGDIYATALATEEGAFIDGRITMKGHAANLPPDVPAQPPAVIETPAASESPIVSPAEIAQLDAAMALGEAGLPQAEETAPSRSDLEPTLPFPPSAPAPTRELPPFEAKPSDATQGTTSSDDKGGE